MNRIEIIKAENGYILQESAHHPSMAMASGQYVFESLSKLHRFLKENFDHNETKKEDE